ncbi:MAG: helix-turn-helix domain-containing protein, partial [candidate division Zixibacteria bacterium]|nr:helix-turn-helix domain-containing protein [Gammaproteobacteria bacterium]NIR25706.1 helix-turn-helix domain-containing protein [Gammaproteobacteria bacterium]NIR65299.1 helix-turn-helix domain-containing protein [candidate division Zixibacteria bacterium]NIS52343.1 helix-turn-helix domain-containing protein [Phycisphaerae bacterium]NIX02142.1 hypothetical protein [Phycisphaerae bacterium]
MSIRAISNVFDHAPDDLSPSETLVLLVLANFTNDETGECWPSIKRLSKMTKLSRRSVLRAISKLEERGEVKIKRRTGESGVKQPSRYIISEHYWRYGDKMTPYGDNSAPEMVTICQGDGDNLSPKPLIDPIEKLDTNVSIKKFQTLLDLWREIFPEKPQPRISNKTLQGKFNTRLKGAHFRDNYEQALRESGKSSFLRGSSWFDLSWFLKN